jgi:hypothetical protein
MERPNDAIFEFVGKESRRLDGNLAFLQSIGRFDWTLAKRWTDDEEVFIPIPPYDWRAVAILKHGL